MARFMVSENKEDSAEEVEFGGEEREVARVTGSANVAREGKDGSLRRYLECIVSCKSLEVEI